MAIVDCVNFGDMYMKIMKRRKQQQQQAPSLGLDDLPNEILVSILSRLSFKEVVKTSVLSRRWTTLWCFTSLSLDLNYRDSGVWIEGTGYERCVSRILELHRGTFIERFSICVPPMLSRNALIDYWITLVMEKEIKHLELDLSKIDDYTLHLDKFLFMLKESRPKNKDLCCLISVRLSNVDVNDELIEYLLSHCPQLENLSVKLSNHVENVNVVGPSMKSFEILGCSALNSLKVSCPSLKSLNVSKCSILKLVEICGENLVSVIYHGPVLKLKIQNALHLSDLHIGGDFCGRFLTVPYEPYHFPPDSLETIKLDVSREVLERLHFWHTPIEPHPFHYIGLLELQIEARVGDDLMFFISVVLGCPVLYKLVVELLYLQPFPKQRLPVQNDYLMAWTFSNNVPGIVDFGHRAHDFLKVVTIINFVACAEDYNFAKQLLKAAKGLEEMFIHPMETSISLSQVRERTYTLTHNLPRTAKLVIL